MTPKIRTRTSPERVKRRAMIAIAVVVPAIIGAIALPRMIAPDQGLPEVQPISQDLLDRMPEPEMASETEVTTESTPAPLAAPATDAPHVGGDLEVSVALRRRSIEAGRTIKARVALRNLALEPVHVPAPGEPQTTLRLLVVDSAGETVRNIVETSADPLPHRTHRLESGAEIAWDVDVVAVGEEPLPPGTYRLATTYDADPAWRRTGLAMWRAPGGARQAEQVTFEITPR